VIGYPGCRFTLVGTERFSINTEFTENTESTEPRRFKRKERKGAEQTSHSRMLQYDGLTNRQVKQIGTNVEALVEYAFGA
jgi:hypothetical protein